MKLPKIDSGYWIKLRSGMYTAGRLKRKKKTELANAAVLAMANVKSKGRAWEDAEEARLELKAARDSAVDDLKDRAAELRFKLASRGKNAVKEAPYTAIFHQGINYYAAATLGDTEKRYRELHERIAKNLPEDDELRREAERDLPPLIEAWVMAVRDCETAQTRAGLARTELDAASEAWARQMERTYGALVQETSRAEAERYFPKARNRGTRSANEE